MSKIAYGYCRVSDDKQADKGLSLEAQQRICEERYRQLAEKIPGLQWGGCFVDPAVSGSKVMFLQRPAGRELQKRLKKGDYVIVTNLDRIFRDLEDTIRMNNLWIKQCINPLYLDIPEIPNTDPMFIPHVILRGLFSHMEVSSIKTRVKRAMADKKARGEAISRRPPFGFKFKWGHRPGQDSKKWVKFVVPDPEYDKLGGYVISMRNGGYSWPRIAYLFNGCGTITSSNERWSEWAIKRLYDWARSKGIQGDNSWQSTMSSSKPSCRGWKRPRNFATTAEQSTSCASPSPDMGGDTAQSLPETSSCPPTPAGGSPRGSTDAAPGTCSVTISPTGPAYDDGKTDIPTASNVTSGEGQGSSSPVDPTACASTPTDGCTKPSCDTQPPQSCESGLMRKSSVVW